MKDKGRGSRNGQVGWCKRDICESRRGGRVGQAENHGPEKALPRLMEGQPLAEVTLHTVLMLEKNGLILMHPSISGGAGQQGEGMTSA